MRVTFFCFAKRKSPKKRRPPVCDPFAVRRGKPASCRLRGAPWNSLRCVAASFRHPRRVSSRGMGAPTPMLTPQPPRRRRSQQGWDSRTSKQPNSRTSIRAIAALGRACAARGACARKRGPSEAKARVDVWFPLPLWLRRGAQGLADQGSRVSERRAAARVERDPAKPEHRRLPRSVSAGDADSGVALSLVPFFRRRERKGLARRATPGSCPEQRHAVTTAKPGFDKLSPNGLEQCSGFVNLSPNGHGHCAGFDSTAQTVNGK